MIIGCGEDISKSRYLFFYYNETLKQLKKILRSNETQLLIATPLTNCKDSQTIEITTLTG